MSKGNRGKNKLIICCWGGPGSGKTTANLALGAAFKTASYNLELNREYVKPWVWEGRAIQPGDQNYIFAKQSRVERMLMKEGVEVIITDSPMALSIMYARKYDPFDKDGASCKQMLAQHHDFCKKHGYKVEHYLIHRGNRAYNPAGRYQTESEAKNLDQNCIDLMGELNIKFQTAEKAGDILDDLRDKGYFTKEEIEEIKEKIRSQFE
ncbi:ATP-binding protein [Bdellovibrio sp. BCCA]|uniref:ATP-binding protein n=1 Tax=Bdellovibrio sp. BCCA TaxID=3136281 RepID=UPI0030F1F047